MLKTWKKAISLVLVFALSMMVCVSAFADENVDSVKDSGVKDSAITYISEADAVLLANQCIKTSVATDDHCSWSDQTTIKNATPIYDLNQQIGYYLFRLNEGYIFVSASSENPKVVAYSYDANFIADNMLKRTNSVITSKDKIVYAGGLDFYKQEDNTYKELDTDVTVKTSDISNMKKRYNNTIKNITSNKAQKNLNTIKAQKNENTLLSSTLSDESYTIPNLWDVDYQVYVTGDFPGYSNHCTPTAATNFIEYWGTKADNYKSALWSGSVFQDLYTDLKTNVGKKGTYLSDILPGIQKYSESRNVELGVGCTFKATSYDDCVYYIQRGPFLLLLWNDMSPKEYKNHTVLAVGTGNHYLRILDGWSVSKSNFFDSDYALADNADGVSETF
ncbi:Spi family protease inhibitor [Caproicibacter fermentans]|uniref:Spi family protease inhibitor n=1 Tax=Caproicibacter fermentans TaxID=2576756 RepID=A0A7G8TD17_9FIRM|nr:Spi family protease inhibitor [Caproicibacter fermentans]QNK41508.1 Spi family protease inhibitor [Caproicibacter fermentans]